MSGCGRTAVLIEELDRQSCLDLLSHTHLGRLACWKGTRRAWCRLFRLRRQLCLQLFDDRKEIEWMRANPLVCVEADEVVGPQKWTSVIVFGSTRSCPIHLSGRKSAPPLSVCSDAGRCGGNRPTQKGHPGRSASLEPLFYRIHIDEITGRRATREPSLDARLSTANSCEMVGCKRSCGDCMPK